MSDNVSEVSFDLNDPTVVETVLNDKDLRKLPLGSEEFMAAANSKFAKTNEVTEESAAEETEQAEGEASDDAEPEAKPEQKKRKGVEKRIDELVREREQLKRELEAVRNGKQPSQEPSGESEKVEESSTFEKAKPKFKDFDNLEDYTEALTDWKLEKREYDRAAAEERTRHNQRLTEMEKTWDERQEAFKSSVDDYDAFVNADAVKAINPTQQVLAYLFDSEFGPQAAYEILSDEETSKAFKELSPAKQIAFIARIEARLDGSRAEDKPEAKKTTVSKAPQPAKSLPKGKAVATSKSIYDKELSFSEYNRLMDERDRAKKAR